MPIRQQVDAEEREHSFRYLNRILTHLSLPEGYDVADVDLSTVELEGVVEAIRDLKYNFVSDPSEYLVDHDGDGILERMVKFDRAEVISYVNAIDFSLDKKIPFEGSDTVKAII